MPESNDFGKGSKWALSSQQVVVYTFPLFFILSKTTFILLSNVFILSQSSESGHFHQGADLVDWRSIKKTLNEVKK